MEYFLDELLISCSSSSSKWMIEVAKEELKILEAQHPNRFGFLKNEIETFIISAESDKQQQQRQPQEHLKNSFPSSSASVSTQASSNIRMIKRKTSADAAIERAEACLRKIRKVKESFKL